MNVITTQYILNRLYFFDFQTAFKKLREVLKSKNNTFSSINDTLNLVQKIKYQHNC